MLMDFEMVSGSSPNQSLQPTPLTTLRVVKGSPASRAAAELGR